MYLLVVFTLVSCTIPQQLIGAFRVGESPYGRNIYFDSYDHEPSEEESADTFRQGVLIPPEEVIDVPMPLAKDYEMSDIMNESLRSDFTDESLQDSQITRNFIENIINQIKEIFGMGNHPSVIPVTPLPDTFYYYLDGSIHPSMRNSLKAVVEEVAAKTCRVAIEDKEKADVVLFGVENCMIQVFGNEIIIGRECYDATITSKIIIKVLGLCTQLFPPIDITQKSVGSFLSRFKNAGDADTDNDCIDKIPHCDRWTANNGCATHNQILPVLCSRSCQVCGDTCKDYVNNCGSNDTVKTCLNNWEFKRFTCANTCGICKSHDAEVCVDFVNECRWLAKKGYCSKYPKIMKEFCKASCGYCKPKCADERDDCVELRAAGGCRKIPGLMQKYCIKTCDMCQSSAKNRDYEEGTSITECRPDTGFIRNRCMWNIFENE